MDEKINILKNDTYRLVKTFRSFVDEYKEELKLLLDSVKELEEDQKNTETDGKEVE